MHKNSSKLCFKICFNASHLQRNASGFYGLLKGPQMTTKFRNMMTLRKRELKRPKVNIDFNSSFRVLLHALFQELYSNVSNSVNCFNVIETSVQNKT